MNILMNMNNIFQTFKTVSLRIKYFFKFIFYLESKSDILFYQNLKNQTIQNI